MISLAEVTAFLVVAIPLFRFLNDWLSARNQFRIKSLELFYQCFEAESNKSMKLVVEQQFKSVFKLNADFDVVEALLLSNQPSKAIQLYKKCKAYVAVESQALKLSDKYVDLNRRKREYYLKPIRNFSLYFLTAMPAIYLGLWSYEQFTSLYTGDIVLSPSHIGSAFISLIASITMAFIAYISVTDSASIKYAEELVGQYDHDFKKADLGVRIILTKRLRQIRNAWQS
ncbi:hypothetical protein [Vibrio parahaemolyticus]|uniref:hypothetical protein n=1 Tax=Vibrio parahaemolyticus TaxID=670 RepID=UPI00235E5861|nr:hypothetical protein [Vibrio parahaemolyticus]HCE2144173.1 hypothetical protein [Vibrio parahaemolyticus]HCG6316490.1 hypothetical protein [Vibrio parahaemolyticus]HCG7174153.1 hypothetical protein [Vibrio parahaemolyticus]HCG9641602.1 hypothetical protein [Vibrio parahaemolyticus]